MNTVCSQTGEELQTTSAGEADAAACMKPRAACLGPRQYVYSIHWAPTEDYLLAGTNAELRLIAADRRAETLKQVAVFTGQTKISFVRWSADGKFALSASDNLALLSVSTHPPKLRELARYDAHDGDVYFVSWSPDGTHALTAAQSGIVRLLSVDTAAATLDARAAFVASDGKAFGVAWAPDGRHAMSVAEDGTARLLAVDFEPPALRELARITDPEWRSAISWAPRVEPMVGTWGARNAVQRLTVDLDTRQLAVREELLWHTSGVDVLEWSHDHTVLLSGGHDDTLRLSTEVSGALQTLGSLRDDGAGVHAASWSTDDAFVAIAASHHDQVTLLDARSCPRSR
ncbi:MAG TPA: WD40 repeat domain-containing protein [Polyangiaceae bacterium]|nr:WD40 repeat domain-containing protein [Polyangiaceae bacterium]